MFSRHVMALLPGLAGAYDASAMVDAKPGTLPLILTVPHDGGEFLGMLAARSNGAIVRDADTRKLAEAIAASLQQRTVKRPYLVIA